MGKKAKFFYRNFGHPIIKLDIDSSEEYCIATTKHYLLFLELSKRIRPKILQLAPNDVVKFNASGEFTSASFSGGQERKIIGVQDNLVIQWDLLDVLKGNVELYLIVEAPTEIISASKFNRDEVLEVVGRQEINRLDL